MLQTESRGATLSTHFGSKGHAFGNCGVISFRVGHKMGSKSNDRTPQSDTGHCFASCNQSAPSIAICPIRPETSTSDLRPPTTQQSKCSGWRKSPLCMKIGRRRTSGGHTDRGPAPRTANTGHESTSTRVDVQIHFHPVVEVSQQKEGSSGQVQSLSSF